MARITSEELMDGLEIRGRRILHRGAIIGHVVRRRSSSGRRLGSFVARSEFVGRINAFGLAIEEVASNREVLLARVARRLVAPANEGLIDVPSAQAARDRPASANPATMGFAP